MRALASLGASLLVASTQAHVTSGRERYGVIGYGIVMYEPPCAYACIDTVKGWELDCGDDHDMDGMHMGGMHMSATTPECRATSDPYLQTLAWCFHTHCQGVNNSTLETVWEMDIVARLDVQPMPAYSYQVALSRVAQTPPTSVVDSKTTLNTTSLVDENSWLANFNGDQGFEKMEVRAQTYSIILFVTCVGIPILFSWFSFLPLNQGVVSRFYATFIDPPLFGRYHAVPVLGLGFVPTRGQGLFIAYIWIINIVLSAVGYEVRDPMSWYSSLEQQLIVYISNRTGSLSFVNLALAVLFASRNNVLLFVTNWSHSTFLLVHRWIAVICALQACLHSAIYLQFYLDPLSGGPAAFYEESKLDYWVWGTVATLALALLLPLSLLPLRRKLYEAFLASHVVLAVLAMIGCMLHIYYRYEWQWGYQTWVWISFAFWLFDRFLARPLRLARNGVKRAFVTVIDDDYLQIDIPGVEGGGHAYLYFPTLTWRVWENHPFSVAAMSAGTPSCTATLSPSPSSSDTPLSADEKGIPPSRATEHKPITNENQRGPGLIFLIRRHNGLTTRLLNHTPSTSSPSTNDPGIPVLLESSYGPQISLLASASPSLAYPHTIYIAGGVGITGVLPSVLAHRHNTPYGKRKLFWSVRTAPLVQAVRGIVGEGNITVSTTATVTPGSSPHSSEDGVDDKSPVRGTETETGTERETWPGGTDVTISIGKRFDIDTILTKELQGTERSGGTTVMVCGPAGMADEVRVAVARLGQKRGVVVRLVEESFSW